jgi:feruloyl esterase
MKETLLITLAVGTMFACAQGVEAEEQCSALLSADFSAVEDVKPVVTNTRLMEGTESVPAYCLVEGRVPVAPSLEFELRLPPSGWNGKFLAIPNIADGDVCNGYLKRGYACAPMFRNGKKGRRDDESLGAGRTMSVNSMDNVFLQPHLLTVSGKAIVDRYYGMVPEKSYFMSCSGGGYSALTLAQSFPWHYDGIIAADANLDIADWSIRALWFARSLQDRNGKSILSDDDIEFLHQAVLGQCDLDDGVKDGVLGNAVGCKFDPAILACKAGKKPGCLTPPQVEAVNRVYGGPMTSGGLQLTTAGVLPGSELQWKNTGALGGVGALALEFSFGGAAPEINASNFDFDHDYRRIGPGALDPRINPDLRKFKAAGGKLLAHAGTNDFAQVTPGMVDYYEITERSMGGRAATQDFFRLFMVPGATHCGRGAGADAVDYLSYLEAWVEQGIAPDEMIAARVSDAYLANVPLPDLPAGVSVASLRPEQRARFAASSLQYPLDPSIPIAFTRPLYPYPLYARYKGTGDPNNALNFGAIDPQSALRDVSHNAK